MTRAIAIDFGTSRTKLAYAPGDGGRPELMRFGNDRPFVRSLVYLPPNSADILWGEDAEHRLASDPGSVIDVPKRRLADPWLRAAGGRKETPQQVLTTIFGDLRRWAGERIKAFGGAPPERLTLTLPGLYRPIEERTVRAAAAAAGFAADAITLVPEPVAAARAWLAETGGDGGDVIVLDAGGGTLDWAWLRREGDGFRIVPECPPDGDRELGGHDVDLLLFDLLQEKAGDALELALLTGRTRWLDRLRALKEDFCLGHPLRPLGIDGREIAIDGREIEAAIEQRFVAQACDALGHYLDKVRAIAGDGLPPVLLVGGSGRLRGLATALEQRLDCTTAQWDRAEFATVLGCIPWKKKRDDVMDKTIITCPTCSQKMRVPASGEIVANCPGCRGQLSVRDGRVEDDIPDAEYASRSENYGRTTQRVRAWCWIDPLYRADLAKRCSQVAATRSRTMLPGVNGAELLSLGMANEIWRYGNDWFAELDEKALLAGKRFSELKSYMQAGHWDNKPRYLRDFLTHRDAQRARAWIPPAGEHDDLQVPLFLAGACGDTEDARRHLAGAIRVITSNAEAENGHPWYDLLEAAKVWGLALRDDFEARRCIRLAEDMDDPNHFRYVRIAEARLALFGDTANARRLLENAENGIDDLKPPAKVNESVHMAQHWKYLLNDDRAAQRNLERAGETLPFIKGGIFDDLAVAEEIFKCLKVWLALCQHIPQELLSQFQSTVRRVRVLASMWARCAELWQLGAGDESSARECANKAEDVANSASDWVNCAEAWTTIGDTARVEAALLRAERVDRGDSRNIEKIASAWKQLLENRQAVASCLSRYEAECKDSWDYLNAAELWHRAAGDVVAVRRCLKGAQQSAQNTQRYADCAKWYNVLKDSAAVRQCLNEASRHANNAEDFWQCVIIAEEMLGDTTQAKSFIRRAEQSAADAESKKTESWIVVAWCWADVFVDWSKARTYIRRAEQVAATKSDWDWCASAWGSHLADEQEARRCKDRAKALS